MSMGNKPTDPKITEDADDVEGHARWRGVDAESEPEGLEKVGGPKERATDEDVEGHRHSFRRVDADQATADEEDDVEGHARRGN